jgi:hypothetical protein
MKTLRLAFCVSLWIAFTVDRIEGATLYLPRSFDPTEFSQVGLAFMNPWTADATATIQLTSAQGATLATVQRTIGSQQQLSILLNQLFPTATAGGYLIINLDNDLVTGFWMYGDFTTSTDGGPLIAINELGPVVAFTSVLSGSEISIANAGSSKVVGNINLTDTTGRIVSNVPIQINSLALFQSPVASLFPSQAASFDTVPYWIQVSSVDATSSLVGTAVTRTRTDNLVTNAHYYLSSTLTFPQIVDGAVSGGTYRTLIAIANGQPSAKTLTITLHQSSSTVPLSVQRTIAPFGLLRSTINDLFNAAAVDGWLTVQPDAGGITGFATYTDTVGGGATAVSGQGAADAGLIFGHIADLPPWWTGLALVNPSSTDAQVEVYSVNANGSLLAGPAQSPKAAFTLSAGSKKTFLLQEVTPQTQTRQTDGGFVFVRTTNAVQIFGTELFFLRSGLVYANVPGTLLGGIGMSAPTIGPPPPPPTGPVTVESVFTGDVNRVSKTSFQAGDDITYNLQIDNGLPSPLFNTIRYLVLGPSGFVMLSEGITATNPTGFSIHYFPDKIPAGAPAGTYTVIGTVEYNGLVSTKTSTFTVTSAN